MTRLNLVIIVILGALTWGMIIWAALSMYQFVGAPDKIWERL